MYNFTYLGLLLSHTVFPAAAVRKGEEVENCVKYDGDPDVLNSNGVALDKFAICSSEGPTTQRLEMYAGVEKDALNRTFVHMYVHCFVSEGCHFAVADAFGRPHGGYSLLTTPFAVSIEKLSDGSLTHRLYDIPPNHIYGHAEYPFYTLYHNWTDYEATDRPTMFGDTGEVVSAEKGAGGGYSIEVKFKPGMDDLKEPVMFMYAVIDPTSDAKTIGLPFHIANRMGGKGGATGLTPLAVLIATAAAVL